MSEWVNGKPQDCTIPFYCPLGEVGVLIGVLNGVNIATHTLQVKGTDY